MKLCSDCVHYRQFKEDGKTTAHYCAFRTQPREIDYVTGTATYYELDLIHCSSERRASTGLFGLFIDKKRCGPEAKNFKAKSNG